MTPGYGRPARRSSSAGRRPHTAPVHGPRARWDPAPRPAHHISLTIAMTIEASTSATIAACVQIQNGDIYLWSLVLIAAIVVLICPLTVDVAFSSCCWAASRRSALREVSDAAAASTCLP